MHLLLAGASGFLGTHLTRAATSAGHTATALTRESGRATDRTSHWDPYAGAIDHGVVEAADVVINLAGAPTLGNPHSAKWAEALENSRVVTTRVLAQAIARSERKPTFLAGNGIAFYGDRTDEGDPVLTETSESYGDALLTRVCRVWQEAAQPAVDAGARVCILRTAPVMDRRSPPLKQLRLLFSLALGAKLGDGAQHMAMVSLRDWVSSVLFLAEHNSISGPVNLCCPTTPTNAEFTRELAHQLHRPALVSVPAFLLRPAAGDMSPELLGSLKVRPAVLESAGHTFSDHDVAAVLRSALAPA